MRVAPELVPSGVLPLLSPISVHARQTAPLPQQVPIHDIQCSVASWHNSMLCCWPILCLLPLMLCSWNYAHWTNIFQAGPILQAPIFPPCRNGTVLVPRSLPLSAVRHDNRGLTILIVCRSWRFSMLSLTARGRALVQLPAPRALLCTCRSQRCPALWLPTSRCASPRRVLCAILDSYNDPKAGASMPNALTSNTSEGSCSNCWLQEALEEAGRAGDAQAAAAKLTVAVAQVSRWPAALSAPSC
jgi:hypothetical protein